MNLWGTEALQERRERSRKLLVSLSKQREKWVKMHRYFYEQVAMLLQFVIEPGKRVLHVRCETGILLDAVQPSHGIGIEICQEMLDEAKRLYPANQYTVADPDGDFFEESLFGKESADYIIFSQIDDTVDIQKALKQLKKQCARHTRLVIYTYNHLWRPILWLSTKLGLRFPTIEQNWLSETDIKNLLELSGYEWLRTYRAVMMPQYLPLLSTFLNRFVAKLPLVKGLCMTKVMVARKEQEAIDPSTLTVSVIIPCKNEKGNVLSAVQRIPQMGRSVEILFCDDKSTDGTQEEVLRVKALYPDRIIRLLAGPGICKSLNVYTGFNGASGDVVMILDADLTTMPEELPYFLEAVAGGVAEFVNGSRLVFPMQKEAMKGFNMLGNKVFSLLFSYLLDQTIKDTLCGTKVMWRSDWNRISPFTGRWGSPDRWGDYDLLFGASKLNLRIIDLPVHYQERIYGVTKMTKVFKNGLIMLRMCMHGFIRLKLSY